jgi:hypothetical protein
MRFESKADADAELDRLTRAAIHRFCPLAKGPCRVNCVAFNRGVVREMAYHFKLYPPGCGAHCLVGGES